MLTIVKNISFKVNVTIIESWDKLPISRSKYSRNFRDYLKKILCISLIDVLLKQK